MDFPLIEYLTILGIFCVVVIVPGPDFAMVLRQSITHGRRTAIFTSAGVASSIIVHSAYSILGLGFIISQSLLMFTIIKFVGAAYLLWLGINAFFAPAPKAPENLTENENTITSAKAYAIGFLTNLLNPKAVLFFISLFTVIISVDTILVHKVFYVLSMSVLLFLWFSLVSIFFTTKKVRNSFYKIGKWFNRVTGLALIFIAVRMALVTHK